MPRVWRFKGHEDFEESCHRLGIPWVPPVVLSWGSKNRKQLWQRKVLMGKIKVHTFRNRDQKFMDRYREAMREATKINGRVDPDSLPSDIREYYITKRRRKNESKYAGKNIDKPDRKIFLHKWYPWSYDNNGTPRVVLQGFYSVKAARKRFYTYYGKEALKHVYWIKGKHALEKGFQVGKSLLIDGKRKKPISKVLLTEAYRSMQQTAKRELGKYLKQKKGLKSYRKEQYFLNLVDKFNYGTKEYRTILKPVSEKQARLSETKKAKATSKKVLYEGS